MRLYSRTREPGRLRMLVALTILPALTTPLAAQQDRNHLYDRVQIGVSGAEAFLNTTIRVDASDGTPGTDINTEDLLGLGKSQLRPRFTLRLRPGRRHEFEFNYMQVRREGFVGVNVPIQFGDSVFNAGAYLFSYLKTDQVGMTYRLALRAKEKSQAGLSVGVGAIVLEAGIAALAVAGDSASILFLEDRKFTGPTASVGLFGRTELARNLYLEGDARGLYVKVSRIRATVLEGGATLRYFVLPWLGGEAGYGIGFYNVKLDPKIGSSALAGRVKYSVQTLRGGVVLGF